MKRALVVLPLAVLFAPAPAPSEPAPECTRSQELDRFQLLRRLSLDLRHRLPSYEEYRSLDDEPDVPEALVDEMLASDEFRIVMRRFHESLLWPNVSTVGLNNQNAQLNKNADDIWRLPAGARQRAYRGQNGSTCGDFEQLDFDRDGRPVPRAPTGDVPYPQEGWVEVAPYWAPANLLRVCAFDAQTATEGTLANGTVVSCNGPDAQGAAECGCGPNLRNCYGPRAQVAEPIWAAMREQLLRLVDDVTVGGRPYSELLTSRRTHVNGPLLFWWRYLANMVALNRTYNPLSDDELPGADAPDWTDQSWTVVERGGPQAGVLTLPAYALRFQTNRGRANRFRIVFTGQYFVPPANLDDTDCDPVAEDLTQRCNCRTCHQVLEPLAAHFATTAEAGSALITDRERFPLRNDSCIGRVNDPKCNRFWVTDPTRHNAGALAPYQFTDVDDALHRQILENLESGPPGLVARVLDDGTFASATVRNLFHTLMAREMNLDPLADDSEIDLLAELTAELRETDDLPALVARLVSLPQYRRVR